MVATREALPEGAIAWALREVRLLFPARLLSDREVAIYETVCRNWARNYESDPSGTAEGLMQKVAFGNARTNAIDAIAELDQTANEYFGSDYARLRQEIVAESLETAAQSRA